MSEKKSQTYRRKDPLIGVSLGERYRVESIIARGGMGVVYRGFDTVLERAVAIKVLIKNLDKINDSVARFLREARAMSALDHPNIVPVYTTGTWEDRYYFVMKLLEGKTLAARIKRVRLSLDNAYGMLELCTWLEQLCAGLSYAHNKGLIHRDVKPSNVIVDEQGHVTLMDFGIVKENNEETMTQTGIVFGTPDYMSPEYAQGLRASAASDQYALGVVAYEMFTAHPPFLARTAFETVIAHIKETPPPMSLYRLGIDSRLEEMVARMMAKSPESRYGSLEEVRSVLLEVRRSPQSLAAPHPTVEYELGSQVGQDLDLTRGVSATQGTDDSSTQGIDDSSPESCRPNPAKVYRGVGRRPGASDELDVNVTPGKTPPSHSHLKSIVVPESAGIYRRPTSPPSQSVDRPNPRERMQVTVISAFVTAGLCFLGAVLWWLNRE